MLEYVASGCSFVRVTYPEAYSDPVLLQTIRDTWSSLQDQYGHKVSFLYNAHIEKQFGSIFKEHFKTSAVHDIYADSGGLQMVTQGLSITPDLKSKIYKNQSDYSDCAMSFDEIPVAFSGAKSSRLDLSNRWFDRDRFEWCARETGRNVYEQIKEFDRNNSTARPIFIVQGNCYDTYMKWTEFALSEIPSELHSRIGGIAMGAAAMGHGTLEDIKRAFYYTQLPIEVERKHMHLLAVGSIRRLIPNLIFIQNGLYDGVHLSYDSTTHTSGAHMGRYFMNGNNYEFNRVKNLAYHEMLADIKRNFPAYNKNVDEFHTCMNTSAGNYEKKFGSKAPVIETFSYFIASSVLNFISEVDSIIKNPKKIIGLTDKVEQAAFHALANVKTLDDFNHWERNAGKYVSSNPVPKNKASSLMSLFEDD